MLTVTTASHRTLGRPACESCIKDPKGQGRINSASMSFLKSMLSGSGDNKMRRTGSFDDLSMGAGRDGALLTFNLYNFVQECTPRALAKPLLWEPRPHGVLTLCHIVRLEVLRRQLNHTKALFFTDMGRYPLPLCMHWCA